MVKGFVAERLAGWRQGTGIERLFFTTWGGSLASILVALVVFFFIVGFWWPYWRSGDMDMWMVYEGFLYTDRLPQEYFDHPAYLTILSLGEWFTALHAGGLLPAHALSTLPPVTDNAASALAWMRATQAARLVSLFIGLGFVTAFAYLMRALVRDWRVALLATFVLAFSGGFMMEMRIVRSELIAAGFGYCGFLIALIVAQRDNTGWRPLLIGIAALLATLAMLNKVQILFLDVAIPPLMMFFGRSAGGAPPTWQSRGRALAVTAAFMAVAALAAALAWPIAMTGLFDPGAVAERTRIFGSGMPIYQALIVVWIFVWMAIYAKVYRIGAAESIAAMAAVIAGIGLGLMVLALHPHPQNAVAVLNPLEKMLGFAQGIDRDGGGVSRGSFVHSLIDGAGLLLARETFVLSSSPRPAIFLQWVVFVAAAFAWRRGERKTLVQVAALLAVSWAIDLVGTFRGLKLEYFILADPLVFIAAAWLLVRVPALKSHRLTYPVGMTLLVATVCVGLAEPIKHSFKRDMPLDFCVPHFAYTKKIERFSFCPP